MMRTILDKYLNIKTYAAPDDGDGGGDDDGTGGDNQDADAGGNDDADAGGSKFKTGLMNKKGDDDDQSDDKGDADKSDDKKGDDQSDDKSGDDNGRPDHIPEKFWDKEKGELKSEDLTKAYSELEKAYSTLKRDKGIKEAPESEDEYFKDGLELDDDSSIEVGGMDDPGLKGWAKVAKAHNIDVDTARSIAKGWLKEMSPFAPEPVDPDAEMEKLGKNGKNVSEGVFTWLESKESEFDDDDVAEISKLSQTAAGMKLMAKFRNFSGVEPIPVVSHGDTTMSATDWHSKYQAAIEAKDYTEQERLDALSEKLWPQGIPQAGVPDTVSNAERFKKSR